ncbi:amino acid permease [Neobacillus niacini]|uniref:APC family permease n=1 Tax=Neobacillus niacini TaxID=86668 RepID=UPI002861338B|nr:amino acid permease [Neobacillus niacini]MDR6998930.1 urea carboxylase system permease [Neobacillus niacini]
MGKNHQHSHHDQDAAHLASLGYNQELKRNLNFFSNFAIAFSFISATTGIFGLFGTGLSTGGPAFIWSWPVVFMGQLFVALTMAEVASHFPIAGSVYQWSKNLVNPTYAWFSGWIYLISLLILIAAVDYGGAPYVAQILGMDTGSSMTLFWITVAIIVIQTFINAFGVKLTALINNIGVIAEIVVMIVLAVVLIAAGMHQPFHIVFETAGTAAGHGSYLPVFMMAMLMSIYVLLGFDSAGSLAEEVINPRVVVPKTMIFSLVLTGIVGGVALLAFVLAIPDLGTAMKSSVALSYVLESNLGKGVSNAAVFLAVLAIFVCGTAIQAAASRLLYSFGRDKQIPGSKLWVKVSPKYETPANAIIFSGIFAVLLILSATAYTYIVSIATIGMYIAYFSVTFGAIFARSRGWNSTSSPWNLGKWGLPVNILAALWGVFVILNLAWPRTPNEPWYINYSIPLLLAVVFGIGAIYYFWAVARTLPVNSQNLSNNESEIEL